MGFYDAVQWVMVEKGITAAQLARETGLYRSMFSDMKAGRTKTPSWDNAKKIIHALGMTYDEFAALEDELECDRVALGSDLRKHVFHGVKGFYGELNIYVFSA